MFYHMTKSDVAISVGAAVFLTSLFFFFRGLVMFTDSFPWVLIWLLILAYAFGFFDWIDRRVRNFEKRAEKSPDPKSPSLSEILAMIGDTPLKVNRLRVRVRWPEKYWTRS